ncbi:MAG: hypothetical protein JNK00_05155 [Flavipsychrobacter sp.]|nr:hypothetical protein [Flavipsychrobacter sp.]
MRHILTTLLLAATTIGASAQYNSRVQLQMGVFASIAPNSYPTFERAEGINFIGAAMQRSVYKNFALKLSYHRWAAPFTDHSFHPSGEGPWGGSIGYHPTSSYAVAENEQISGRRNYNMLELIPVYSRRFGCHEAYGGAGLSFAWGEDSYYRTNVLLSGISMESIYFGDQYQEAHYFGGVAELGYNLYVAKRIHTGLSVSGRHYGQRFTTMNLQLNIGYNFNSFK